MKSLSLFYWAREARSSSAEVDYLFPWNGQVFPVEVKAGKTGTLRSMSLFLDKFPPEIGIKISQQSFDFQPPVLSLPFYAIESLPRIIKTIF